MQTLRANATTLEVILNFAFGLIFIPFNQRPYEWNSYQVKRLFNDVHFIYLKNQQKNTSLTNHVLNFFLFQIDDPSDRSSKKQLYDGQQRTITCFILLAVLIEKLKSFTSDQHDPSIRNNASMTINSLTSLYLYCRDWKDPNKIMWKIEMDNASANSMLYDHVFSGKPLNDTHRFNDFDKAIYNNYLLLQKLVEEKFPTSSATLEDIKEFIDNLLNNVNLVEITTTDIKEAEKMFENLNSGNEQIQDFNVLKNTLVHVLGVNKVRPFWLTIEGNTNLLNKNLFLHLYLNVINGKTSSSDMHTKIKNLKNLDCPNSAQLFLQELTTFSQIFLEIQVPSQRRIGTKQEQLEYDQHIQKLNLLNAQQYKTILMAMGIKNYSLEETNIVLQNIIALHLRNIFICGNPANKLENFYPRLANEIYTKNVSIEYIVDSLVNEMEQDKIVTERFMAKQINTTKNERIIRMILKDIYSSSLKELNVNQNANEVNLEHILPVNPQIGSQWMSDFPDENERKLYTQKIGNFTVLSSKLNSKIRNDDFSKKKGHYVNSEIVFNHEIAAQSVWKQEQIDKRTKDLCSKFLKLWPK